MLLFAVLALSGGLAQSLGDEPDGTILTPPAITEPLPDPEPSEDPSQATPEAPADPVVNPVPDLPNTIEPVTPVQAPVVLPDTPKPAVVLLPSAPPKPVTLENPIGKPPTRPAPKLDAGEPSKPALTKPIAKPAPKPAARPVIARPAPKPAVTRAPVRGKMTLILKSTGYNSHRNQTDSTPFITATGSRVRFGVVALSRDLLRRIPYGSKVLIEDLGTWKNGQGRGSHRRMLSRMVFIVEDTMHPRKAGTLDVWFPARSQAIKWGARRIKITVIEYGRGRR